MGATLDHGKLWTIADGATPGTGRITLNIAFLDGTRAQAAAVRRLAPGWLSGHLGRRFAFRFDVAAKDAHVRIRFADSESSTSWSKIGRDALLQQDPKQPTMVLSRWDQRDVLHEFGHVLGLKHEHQHPNIGIKWNKPRVRQEMWLRARWTPQMVEDNIFAHFSKDCVCTGDPKPDLHSVMLYPIDPNWTLDHFVTPLNTTISKRDRACLEREYGV